MEVELRGVKIKILVFYFSLISCTCLFPVSFL